METAVYGNGNNYALLMFPTAAADYLEYERFHLVDSLKPYIENGKIRADMIDGAVFPHLVQKYAVMAVPKIVINEKQTIEGAVPITEFLKIIEQI